MNNARQLEETFFEVDVTNSPNAKSPRTLLEATHED